MSNQTGLIETSHPFPEDERGCLKTALARVYRHFAVENRSFRETYDAIMEDVAIADGVTLTASEQTELPGWWVRAGQQDESGRVVFFLHGGGYHLGSARAYRGFVSQLVLRLGVDAFILDYPLAPENPFPAAYDASVSALRWLMTQSDRRVAVMGDSAGGGLALATISGVGSLLQDIASIVVFSPYTDLAFTGPSLREPGKRDIIIQADAMMARAAAYLHGTDPRDGRASPLYSVPESLPPLAIQVGFDELLLDDSRRYAAIAAERGGLVNLDIFENLHHVFQISVGVLPSADKALDDAAAFVSRHW
jgi:monoterpene epsilon-lactone hydrolase